MSYRVKELSEDDEVPLEPYGLRSGQSIFHCDTCKAQRSYGYGRPDQNKVMLLCNGTCLKHTWHTFLRVY